ncbi:TPA: damage-inducible type I toxin DinQ [Enterobacter hormaechei]
MEKRVRVFIEKTVIVLKALIALLELIRQFID